VSTVVLRVLVAIEPNMYAEVLAFHLRQERPRCEVSRACAETLRAEAQRTRPHLIIANEVPSECREGKFWAEVRPGSHLAASIATIAADGYSQTIYDVTLQDFLAVVDKAQEEFAHYC
jgi:hypothetical protein